MTTDTRLITSLTNPLVKRVRALHLRKTRDTTGLFLAEGLKIAAEAFDLGHIPKIMMFGPEARDHPLVLRIATAARGSGGEVVEVHRDILEKVSRRDNPQTVISVYDQVFVPILDLNPAAASVWIALQEVRDPGNLGTIIRTADAAGCGGVVLVGACCDPYSVESVRATMGSIFAVPLFKLCVEDFLEWRVRWPGGVVGTRLSAEVDHRQAVYRRPSLILMGNEQHGLPDQLAQICDVSVKIPMRGRADSLNLSVATGIMIYAASD